MRIASGSFDTAIVYGYSKSSDSSPQYYSGMIADPFFLRPLGVEAITAAALQAGCYYRRFGITESQAARVAVKNRRNALDNPFAQIKGNYTVEDVMDSPRIASPIKRLDASPVTDGCCAVLLASAEAVRRFSFTPAWIDGLSFCTDAYYLGHRDLCIARSARKAAEKAYAMAGIRDPRREIGVAELHEPFSFQELMLSEALGFCEEGGGGHFIESGASEPAGSLPINLSGGALSANPIFAAGLIRLAEAANLITGQSEHSSIEAKKAVAHATSGFALQSNIVYVLSSH
jgi:acetyl-CoA C-acetyltransferase